MDKNYNKIFHLLLIVASYTLASADNNTLTATERKLKAFGVFNVVRFPNDPCGGLNGAKNGTCYTASECTTRNGVSVGSCANSFGVCCTFTLGCGGLSRENCTYFDSPAGIGPGACTATICKTIPGICSLRIDFNTFVITGPNTVTFTELLVIGGSVALGGGAATTRTECLTDTFSVTGTGSGNPPVICGSNGLQHTYVDASEECNKLTFQLGNNAIGTTIANRQWSLKVTQISCMSPILPPPGCTQYFFGSTSGTVQTFNFGPNNVHLANQAQTICFRRERGFCKLCLIPTISIIGGAASSDFVLSSMTAAMGGTKNSKCCGYGANGMTTKGFDCVVLPGATNPTKAVITRQKANQICGNAFVTASGAAAATLSICTTQTPFQIQFLSDAYEWQNELQGRGFKLAFTEIAC